MNSLVKLLAESAHALDKAGLFKEADVVDDMIKSVAAMPPETYVPPSLLSMTPADRDELGYTLPPNARRLLANMNSLLGQLKPADAGSSVAVKAAKAIIDQLDSARSSRRGDTVRVTAQDALKRFLAISNGQNQATNDMFQPIVKPMVDALQAMIRMPDALIWD